MTDDIERQLDDFYRRFDDAGRRIEARWTKAPTRRRMTAPRGNSLGAWIAAGIAAVAAILVIVLASVRSAQPPSAQPVAGREPPRSQPPPSVRVPDLKPVPAPAPKPTPEPQPQPPPPPTPPSSQPPTPSPQPPEEPKPEPPQPPRETTPEPAPPAERAVAAFAETDGTFEVAGRKMHGPQKDVKVAAGDKLRAESVTKLVLSSERFLLLSPKTQIEFEPTAERLIVKLEQGEVLAELIGAGAAVRVQTRACAVDHVGTVCSVRAEGDRTTVAVEEGRVECRNATTAATVSAGQQAVATVGRDAIPVADADLRRLSWAHAYRPAERALFQETFAQKGRWQAEVAGGAARGLPDNDYCAAKIALESDEPIFRVPPRGRFTLAYRAERAATLIVQIFAKAQRLNFQQEVLVVRTSAWKTIAVDFDKFIPTDKAKRPATLQVGGPITTIQIQYGEAGEKINFEVDSITVTELRP